MKLTRSQWLILLGALLTIAIQVVTNIATDQIPDWLKPYLWLAWPLLILLIILFLFITLRQAPTESGPPSCKLVRAYLQEVAAEPVRTLADEVLGEAEFVPREVTAQETRGLFPRFAAVYRPSMPAEAAAGGHARPEPLEAVLARERRLVLLGEPGMGKTTSLRHLAWEAAKRALAKPPAGSGPVGGSPEIPIYVELKYYNGEAELETLLARRVDDVLKRRRLTLGYDEAERTRVMRAWLADKNTRFLLLLDGLNEVAPDHRVSALNALEGLLSYPHRLLLSCREQDYDESLRQHAAAFVLQGLQEDEILGYLRARLGFRGEPLFNDQIDGDEKMQTLVTNPLMLWLVGEVARANPEAHLPPNRGQLFRVFVEAMPGLRRKEGVPMPNVPQDVVKAALRALAFAMQEHGPPPPDLGLVRGWGLPTATYRLEDVLAVGKAWRFLKSDGQHGEPVEFLHPLFQEYFAADELRARLERQRDYAAVLGDRPFTGEWDEVIVMLAGIHDDPVGLVKWLGKEVVARQQGRAALLVHRCWETSDAVGDAGAGAAVVDALIQALRDQNALVRAEATWPLAKIGDPRAVEPLIRALGDSDRIVRSWAVLALGVLGDPRAVEPLIQALGDPDGEVCQRAAVALGRSGAPQAVEPLIQALRNPTALVRAEAAGALGVLGDPRAVEPLIQALGDPDEWVRWQVAEALGEIGASAIEPLIKALRDPSARVRRVAAMALGRIGDPQAVEALIQALSDPDEGVRWEVAVTLGKIGDPRALPELEWVAREDAGVTLWGKRVADVAREAAEKIRGRMSSG